MNRFLLDTNIPSELTRRRPESRVTRWLDEADDDLLYLSVISLGEILKGVTILPESKRRAELEQVARLAAVVSRPHPAGE